MARYIDADKLIEHIKDLPTWREVLGRGWLATKYPDGTFDCEDVINSIVNAPTADVVEVVRCKDCLQRLGKINSCGGVYCNLHKGYFDKDGYCNYGKLLKDERKDA